MLSSVCNEKNEFEVYIKIDIQARRNWHIFFSGPNCYKSGVYVYIIGATYGGLISGPRITLPLPLDFKVQNKRCEN